MKLLIAIVHPEDADNLIEALKQQKHQVTRLESWGGFLKNKNVTLLLGLKENKVAEVLKIIKSNCRSRTEYISPAPSVAEPGEFFLPTSVKVKVGGATVFILNIERYERL